MRGCACVRARVLCVWGKKRNESQLTQEKSQPEKWQTPLRRKRRKKRMQRSREPRPRVPLPCGTERLAGRDRPQTLMTRPAFRGIAVFSSLRFDGSDLGFGRPLVLALLALAAHFLPDHLDDEHEDTCRGNVPDVGERRRVSPQFYTRAVPLFPLFPLFPTRSRRLGPFRQCLVRMR